ncbi:hypothetical protein ACFQI7_11690 [Paenibacillus allorhizosphaerae]|uniref:Uncharacterized protein n=1 Tax=Paenibacillus allorhizosphaerae TaxID=2849866 RepID=A0ABM8VHB5_9BACL|nr:hypothetical protein [Paenibacillus allorhizosphaerae]CAG7641498.1 hypothetical protein PAECIP111802_02748 [Paenibacillus allorhizosphaerae]
MNTKRPTSMPPEQASPEADKPDDYLPPRRTVHQPEKEKWLKYFYRTLLWLFIFLVVGLLVWGWKLLRG